MPTETDNEPRRFTADQHTLFFDPQADPIAEISDGERIVVETLDSVCGIAKSEAPKGFHIDELIDRAGGACPVTGPFHVVGSRPGDVLEIELHRVEARPPEGHAWTAVFDGFGALADTETSLQEPLGPETLLVPYRHGVASFPTRGSAIDVPMRPFLGTVGVAPARERRMTFSQSPEYLGDVDQPALTAGATLVLPVNVAGGLVGFGDAHAAQGDGEITGAALEIEAEAELTLSVRDADEVGYISLPQINTAEWIGSVAGYQGTPLTDCASAAYTDLVRRLERSHGFRRNEAYMLLGQVGRLQVGNMIPPFYSVLATVERRYLQ